MFVLPVVLDLSMRGLNCELLKVEAPVFEEYWLVVSEKSPACLDYPLMSEFMSASYFPAPCALVIR